jgi:stage II sporulation protein D
MSQYGANGMAKAGATYEEILKHYYTGVELEKLTQ